MARLESLKSQEPLLGVFVLIGVHARRVRSDQASTIRVAFGAQEIVKAKALAVARTRAPERSGLVQSEVGCPAKVDPQPVLPDS